RKKGADGGDGWPPLGDGDGTSSGSGPTSLAYTFQAVPFDSNMTRLELGLRIALDGCTDTMVTTRFLPWPVDGTQACPTPSMPTSASPVPTCAPGDPPMTSRVSLLQPTACGLGISCLTRRKPGPKSSWGPAT